MPNDYYFLDVNTKTLEIVAIGLSETANHSGDTDNEDVHRIFMSSPGQYNKFKSKISESQLAKLSIPGD